MNKPRVISLTQAVEALETLAKAVATGAEEPELVTSMRPTVAHGIRLAIKQLRAMEQYDVTVVCGSRMVQRGQIPERLWAAAEQQAARTMIDQIAKRAAEAGLIETVMNAIDVDPENPSTRITARCAFLTPAEPEFRMPEGGEQG